MILLQRLKFCQIFCHKKQVYLDKEIRFSKLAQDMAWNEGEVSKINGVNFISESHIGVLVVHFVNAWHDIDHLDSPSVQFRFAPSPGNIPLDLFA